MISNSEGVSNNVFPGRLKSIVINKWLTVSYAGLSIQAIDAARRLNQTKNLSTDSTIDILREVTEKYYGELDFIICSHENGARLIKISNGTAFEGVDFYWIGNSQAVSDVTKAQVKRNPVKNLPDYITEDEIQFTNTFVNYMNNGPCQGVGGAVINSLCSEFGHCYQNHAGAFSWDTIIIGQDDYEKRQELNKTGMYYFEYSVTSSSERGEAIVGLYFAQSNTGYIYNPLIDDDAIKIPNIDLSNFSQLVNSGDIALLNSIISTKTPSRLSY